MRLDCLPPLAPVTPVLFLPGAPRYHLASNVSRACIVIQLGLRSRQAFAVQARSLAVVRTRRSARLVWLEGTAIRVVLLLPLAFALRAHSLEHLYLDATNAPPASIAMHRGSLSHLVTAGQAPIPSGARGPPHARRVLPACFAMVLVLRFHLVKLLSSQCILYLYLSTRLLQLLELGSHLIICVMRFINVNLQVKVILRIVFSYQKQHWL